MATALKLKNDIKKLKAAIGSKATPKSFVPKLKAQLDKAENELASLKKSGRPRKTSTTKGTEKTLTALQKLIQKKKYGVYQGAGVDLKKDEGEGAFATGRRVSKGLKSNQWGDKSDNKGNVYYEYRPNRLDVKQPKKKQTYPKLEKGGKAYSTDMQPHFSGNDRYMVKTDKGEETFISVKEFNDYIKKLENEGYKRMADGGMMAKGGEVKYKDVNGIERSINFVKEENRLSYYDDIRERKEIAAFINDSSKIVTPSGSNVFPNPIAKAVIKWSKKNGYKFIQDDKEYADGGMMAKGGQISGTFKFIVYKTEGNNFVSTQLKGVSPNNVMIKGVEGKLKGNDYNSAENVAYVILDEHDYIDRVEIVKVGASVLKNKKVAAINRDKDDKNRFSVDYYAKGGYMADGGEVGKGFYIREMKEKLSKMFPDSFGFTVGNFSKEGDLFKNSSALIVDTNSPFNGLQDSEIKSNLFFPQYKRDHDIRFRIYQGGENTYFYFLLESENGDQYIGQFGFKDEGDVSADYITRFIAFLMEQYGLPFEVKHSVMAKGGYMAGGGEMHKADYFKDGGKVFSEKELKEILDEALGHFYQGLNQIDLAMRYLEVKGQGGLKTPLSNKLKLDDLRESVEKIDEYISK